MQPEIAEQLLKVNHQFYQTFANHFSETRQRIQPGVLKVIDSIPRTSNILDLGCGNGVLASYLRDKGHKGSYVGMDTTPDLIEIARDQNIPNTLFFTGDLTNQAWISELPHPVYDVIFCFAVMHHLPGNSRRLKLLNKVNALLAPSGQFIHSNWQFLLSKKLRGRIQPWEIIGLTEDQVDEHDYLIDWRRGGKGLRYVHYFTSPELLSLAGQTGFEVIHTFSSDGSEGNLGLYQVWEKSNP